MLRGAAVAVVLSLVPAAASATERTQAHVSGAHAALQRQAERLLAASRARSGAVVMAEIDSGRVLAWASRGSDVDLVVTPVFPPASLLKVVTAAALLEDRHVYRSTPQCWSGGARDLEGHDVAVLCRPGEPKLPFGEALGRSINVVFGRLAVAHLTPVRWTEAAHALGLVAPPVDVAAPPGVLREPASPLALARAAAGFARDARVSPLGAMAMMHTIANDGAQVKLGLRRGERRVVVGRALRSSTARALARMLGVTTRRGTARHSFKGFQGVAGKTGTLSVGPPPRLLSWFAGFDEDVAIAVMLANDRDWWRKAHELARELLETARDMDVAAHSR